MAAMRARRSHTTFPSQLVAAPRWIRRSAKKVPITIAGTAASSTDPTTWSTFAEATESTAGVGLGFVLNGDGIICIDIDHCIEGNVVAPWAQRFLDSLPKTYIERSPSGDGLHVWGRAQLPFGGRHVDIDGGRIEVYGSGRYLTMTGDAWCAKRTLADLTATLTDIV